MIEINLDEKLNHIHLLSGGLDSSYSLLKIARKIKKGTESYIVHPIFFDYGHYSADTEWERSKKIVNYIRDFLKDESIIADPIKISLKSDDLFEWCRSDSFLGNEGYEKEAEIENRNMVLFSVLASYLIACAKHQDAKSTDFVITSGFQENELSDCNTAFFTKFSELLRMYKEGHTFRFDILRNMGRQVIINKTKRLLRGNERELKKFLQLTISCYSPTKEGQHCGICSKCRLLRNDKKNTAKF